MPHTPTGNFACCGRVMAWTYNDHAEPIHRCKRCDRTLPREIGRARGRLGVGRGRRYLERIIERRNQDRRTTE